MIESSPVAKRGGSCLGQGEALPDTTREEAAWGDYDLAVAAELRRAAKEQEVGRPLKITSIPTFL